MGDINKRNRILYQWDENNNKFAVWHGEKNSETDIHVVYVKQTINVSASKKTEYLNS